VKKDETIDQWCERRGISVTTFYKWEKRGRAPVVIRIGGAARITAHHDAEWVRREAKRTKSKAAKQERERRSEIASKAGKIAAESPKHIWQRRRAAKQAAE
jgi:predicted DNA-binding transcriptional regulator AlpA